MALAQGLNYSTSFDGTQAGYEQETSLTLDGTWKKLMGTLDCQIDDPEAICTGDFETNTGEQVLADFTWNFDSQGLDVDSLNGGADVNGLTFNGDIDDWVDLSVGDEYLNALTLNGTDYNLTVTSQSGPDYLFDVTAQNHVAVPGTFILLGGVLVYAGTKKIGLKNLKFRKAK